MTEPLSPPDSPPSAVPHPIWSALLSPPRAVEVRAWLSKNPNREVAKALRGAHGETMLHWAAMADMGLLLDLVAAGLDINAKDGSGRTPADWLLERLWMTHEEGVGNLTALNLRKLRLQTDDLLSVVWGQGGRPENTPFDYRGLAVRTGLWQVVAAWADRDGVEIAWKNWGGGQTLLHHWPLGPAETGRDTLLDLWLKAGLPIDQRDDRGRTALWVATFARLKASVKTAAGLDAAIDVLLEKGADPASVDAQGRSPLSLPLTEGAEEVLLENLTLRLQRSLS